MKKIIVCLLFLCSVQSFSLLADNLKVAVASNFKNTLEILAVDFYKKTGHKLIISSASTGKLYAQIIHGAPFDIFLSADVKRIDFLIDKKKAKSVNAEIYALGKLVLFSKLDWAGECKDILYSSHLKHLAITNPGIAPYGVAAQQVLNKLGLWEKLASRLVMGENVAQTMLFVSTKNAEAGFVARSMIDTATLDLLKTGAACIWNVPAKLHQPVKQKMVVLDKPGKQTTAQKFIQYMRSDEAKSIIQSVGYDVL